MENSMEKGLMLLAKGVKNMVNGMKEIGSGGLDKEIEIK